MIKRFTTCTLLCCMGLFVLAGCNASEPPPIATPTAIPTLFFAPLGQVDLPPTPTAESPPTETPAPPIIVAETTPLPASADETTFPAPLSPLPLPAGDALLSPVATPTELQTVLPIAAAETVTRMEEISPTSTLTTATEPDVTPTAEATPTTISTLVITPVAAITMTETPTVVASVTPSLQLTTSQNATVTPTPAISATKTTTDALALPLVPTLQITFSGALTVDVGDPAVRFLLWQWRQSELADGTLITPTRLADYTIQVFPNGAARVQADCNVGVGWWSLAEDSTLTLDLRYSLARCSDESLYRDFAAQLRAATAFQVRDDELTIFSGPDGDVMRFTPAPPAAEKEARLTWAELGAAAYRLDETHIAALTAGELFVLEPAGDRELVVGLSDWRSFGDLNGDALEDAAVILIVDLGDDGLAYYLFPVINHAGKPQPQRPVYLGNGLLLRDLALDAGVLTVEWATPGRDEAACCPIDSRRLTFAWQEDSLALVQSEEVAPVGVRATADPAPVGVQPGPGARQVAVSDVIAFDAIHSYVITPTAGQLLTVTISSPNDTVNLSMYGVEDPFVLRSVRQERTSWAGEIPAAQPYMINLVSVGETTPYTLTIEFGSLAEPQTSALRVMATTGVPLAIANRLAPLRQSEAVLYLTFDDGPTPPFTNNVMDVLARNNAKAVFFVIGSQAERQPTIIDAQFQAGHGLGNHTYNHPSLSGIGRDVFFEEIGRTSAILGERGSDCLRPPFGATDAYTRAYAAELGYHIVLWNVDTRDWSLPGVDAIVASLLNDSFPGAIILMHDGGGDRSQTVAALEQALPQLAARGYRLDIPYCTARTGQTSPAESF